MSMSEPAREWTAMELVKTTASFFQERGVGEPRLSAELLLGHVLREERLQLYLHHGRPVYPAELERYRELCRKRLEGWPVQYLTGEQFFLGRRFMVDSRVLIPRPETELVVEYGLERVSSRSSLSVLDVGTGSGCIAVSVALAVPDALVAAVDISEGALEVARSNARLHGVEDRVRFSRADLFSDELPVVNAGGYDLVISNPPYIPDREWEGLQIEVRGYEPRQALTVPEGMECYRALVSRSCMLLRPGGIICLELHADAARQVKEMLEEKGFTDVAVLQDYSGFDRIALGRRIA
ncbi:MAG: peptide chain release factor N(5)-glutamine methyltransferase [Prosthecochloris sp.]|nr:peptide chain release factor N(5)-glutamine methyltransferase [Prosthecochloris sp.]